MQNKHYHKIFDISIGILIILAGLYYDSWWGLMGLFPLIYHDVKNAEI